MKLCFLLIAMGNACNHERTKIIRTIDENKGLLFTTKIVEARCLDCLTNGQPTIFRKELTQGKITGFVYSKNDIDTKECKHKDFVVDERTEKRGSDSTLSGTMIGMLTAGWFEPRHHYIVAEATCNRCTAKFYVSCSYYSENKWKNYVRESVETRGKWKIVMKKVSKTNTKSEIAYVES